MRTWTLVLILHGLKTTEGATVLYYSTSKALISDFHIVSWYCTHYSVQFVRYPTVTLRFNCSVISIQFREKYSLNLFFRHYYRVKYSRALLYYWVVRVHWLVWLWSDVECEKRMIQFARQIHVHMFDQSGTCSYFRLANEIMPAFSTINGRVGR